MRIALSALTALALMIVLYSAPADAYCLMLAKGKTISWKATPVKYRISANLKDAAVLAAIHKAFAAWGAVGCSKLSLQKDGTFPLCADAPCKAFGTTKGTIDVYWFTGKSDLFKNTSDPKSPYASFAYPLHDGAGAISGASIGVNASDFKWSPTGAGGTIDVQGEMTALVGGVIGLADSKIAGATMSGKITYGDTSKRTLAQDDLDGLRHLYLAKGCPAPPTPGKDGCSTGTPVTDGPPPKLDVTPAQQDAGADKQGGGDTFVGSDGASPRPEASVGDSNAGNCTATSQCGAGQICSTEGQCVNVGGDDDEGCSCAVGQGGGGSALLGLFALLWMLRRRRVRP